MKIGMVSIWFHRGQSEVTKTIRQALVDSGHEVFIFGRMGGVHGMAKQEKTDPYWQVPNLYFYPRYEIPGNTLVAWAKINKLEAVIFNEEYDFDLPAAIQGQGIKTVHYVDFLHPGWAGSLRSKYNQLWSASSRTSFMLQEMGLGDITTHIGWGVPTDTPCLGATVPEYDFFHNAGWLGINCRKGTDLVLWAFESLQDRGMNLSMLIHSQMPVTVFEDKSVVNRINDIPGLTWLEATVPSPGLYHCGKVVVQPSRMEGLGLTIIEGLWQGRTVITSDEPPMNEFVTRTEDRVAVRGYSQRYDGLSFPECQINVADLAEKMYSGLRDWAIVGRYNRTIASNMFEWFKFRQVLDHSVRMLPDEVGNG